MMMTTMTRALVIATLMAGVAGGAWACPEHEGKGRGSKYGGPMALFDRADGDKDGVLTQAEYAEASTGMFQRFDRNGDGVWTDADKPADAAPSRRMKKHGGWMKDRLDTDKDGVITRAEFDASRAMMWAKLDRNNDGAVSRDEVATLKQQWRDRAAQRENGNSRMQAAGPLSKTTPPGR